MKEGLKKKLIAGGLAFLGACGIETELAIVCQNNSAYTEILLIPCIYLFYRIYLKGFSYRQTRGFYVLTGGLSALFSAMLIAGGVLDGYSEFGLSAKLFFQILSLITAIYPILSTMTIWLDEYNRKEENIQNDKKLLPICFVLVTFVWVLAYLALFPGVYATTADAPYWYYEFSRPDVPITSQWAPLYCAIYYSLMRLGEFIFGSHEAGFAIFSFVQMSFVLFVVWNMLVFVNRRFRTAAVVCTAAFFALLPTHVILSLTSAQDPVFAACFAMCMLQLFKLAESPETYWMKKENYIKLAAWLILFCMMRNNGMYAILIMIVFAAVFLRKYRRQIFLLTGAVVAVMLIYQGPVYNMLGIQKGTAIREILSLPLQQMAYVYNYRYEELSEEQIEQMLVYMSDDDWRTYMPCLSDHIKYRVNTEAIKNDIMGFIKSYIDIFLEEPGGYVKGAAAQTFGLWYPNKKWPDERIWHPYIGYLCADGLDSYGMELLGFAVSRSSLFPAYEELLGILYGRGDDHSGYGGNLSMAFSNVPVLGVLSKAGIYFWMMMYLFFYAVYRRWSEPLMMIGLGVGIFITVLLSPVIFYRYCAPIIFAAPLFIAIFFVPWTEKGAPESLPNWSTYTKWEGGLRRR